MADIIIIRCGTAQIISPCFADQPTWSERVEYLGMGVSVGPLDHLSADKLSWALDQVMKEEVVTTTKMYQGEPFGMDMDATRLVSVM